jgi:protein tyrosine phosphatase (PTP) superfamily phosphohydrolase (DUF442 family)
MPAPVAEPRPRASLARSIVIGLVLGSLLACAAEIGRMFVTRNEHEIVAGRVYRTAQLNPEQLERFVHEHNVKTVVNLRGRPFNEWYPEEARATQALGISQEDVTTSANRLPPPGEIRRLIEIFDNSEYPILIHCQQGADRTGLASAMYLLLHTDADYATARHQCSPRYGHLPVHTAVAMDEFFDLYEAWLATRGEKHSPELFRHWATSEYCPGSGRAKLELVDAPKQTTTSEPQAFKLRAYNISRENWRFTAGSSAGIRAEYLVHDSDGLIVYNGEAGLLNKTVPPGDFIDLDLPIPALPHAGQYVLWVDLSQRNVSFTQYGSEPLTHDWEARVAAPVRDR